jgi:pyruvate formate lyase activating enzyme
LHLSRYFPRYKMNTHATSPDTILELAEIASGKLYFVYIGNIMGNAFQDTICPQCSKVIAVRDGYTVSVKNFNKDGACISCGYKVVNT